MSSRLSTDTHNLPNYNISIRNVKSLKDLNILYCFIRLWKGKFWLIALTRFLCMKNMLVPLGCPFLTHIIHYWGHCSFLLGEELIPCYMWSCAFIPQESFFIWPSENLFISRWHYRTNNAKHHSLQRGSVSQPRKTRTWQSKCFCLERKEYFSELRIDISSNLEKHISSN